MRTENILFFSDKYHFAFDNPIFAYQTQLRLVYQTLRVIGIWFTFISPASDCNYFLYRCA